MLMLTMNKLTKILDLVEYRDWNWRVFEFKDEAGFLIQLRWDGVDTDTNTVTEQSENVSSTGASGFADHHEVRT